MENNTLLFNRYIVPNLDIIKSLTKHYTKSPGDVLDNYQEILIQLFKYIHTYDNTKSLETWLHIAVKRYCMHFNNKATVQLHQGTESKLQTNCYYQEYSNSLDVFTKSLTESEKDIVSLLYQGYTITEISKTLHIHASTYSKKIGNIKVKYYTVFKPHNAFIDHQINKSKETQRKAKKLGKYRQWLEWLKKPKNRPNVI